MSRTSHRHSNEPGTEPGNPYAPNETAPVKRGYHEEVTKRIERTLPWDHPELDRVTRLRLVSSPGFPRWDVSYCHGRDTEGRPVDVSLPFGGLPKGGLSRAIVEHARRDGVYAKGLGIFGVISTLQM